MKQLETLAGANKGLSAQVKKAADDAAKTQKSLHETMLKAADRVHEEEDKEEKLVAQTKQGESEEGGNWQNVPLQEKFHRGVLKGGKKISDAP